MDRFSVTFETITPESAEFGETASAGYLAENVSLGEAIDIMGTGQNGIEADSWPVYYPRWFTAYTTNEDYHTGETENRSLHIPDGVTAASRRRIARLLGCYGAPA